MLIENTISAAIGIALVLAFGYGIAELANANEAQRDRQRAACVDAGGTYAVSQGVNASPRADYCIY